ncbi:MAG: EamA family transporter [Patescibacteria group bacterium]|nr:EamA family transporter [Patescibacteria group bacterium]
MNEISFLGFMLVGTFFLGYNDIQYKRSLEKGMDERLLVGLPFLVAGLILIVLMGLIGVPHVGAPFWKAYTATVLLNVVSQAVFMRAFKLADASIVAPLRLIIPIFVIATGYVFLAERPPLTGMLGIFITMFGVWLLLFSENAGSWKNYFSSENGKGVLLGLFGSLLFSISFPFDKITVVSSSALFASGLVSISIGALTILVHLYSPSFRGTLRLSLKNWRPLLNISLFRAAGTVLTNQALVYTFAAYASSLKRLQAVWTVVLSGTFLNEKHIGKKILATAIMFGGLLFSVIGR